jgi:hypothetical protein
MQKLSLDALAREFLSRATGGTSGSSRAAQGRWRRMRRVGDGSAATGNAVTVWGVQWHKLNTLTGGPAPASFKGFEDKPAQAACGQDWTADPGNSTPPPSGSLPAYTAVIVSSSVTQSGNPAS